MKDFSLPSKKTSRLTRRKVLPPSSLDNISLLFEADSCSSFSECTGVVSFTGWQRNALVSKQSDVDLMRFVPRQLRHLTSNTSAATLNTVKCHRCLKPANEATRMKLTTQKSHEVCRRYRREPRVPRRTITENRALWNGEHQEPSRDPITNCTSQYDKKPPEYHGRTASNRENQKKHDKTSVKQKRTLRTVSRTVRPTNRHCVF